LWKMLVRPKIHHYLKTQPRIFEGNAILARNVMSFMQDKPTRHNGTGFNLCSVVGISRSLPQ